MRTDLVLDALRMALGTRNVGADFRLAAHTDRGSQYTSDDYGQVIDDHKVLASVGSVGDAYGLDPRSHIKPNYLTTIGASTRWLNRSSTRSRPS
jgi:putative transposase